MGVTEYRFRLRKINCQNVIFFCEIVLLYLSKTEQEFKNYRVNCDKIYNLKIRCFTNAK